jgi:hypothetical protein
VCKMVRHFNSPLLVLKNVVYLPKAGKTPLFAHCRLRSSQGMMHSAITDFHPAISLLSSCHDGWIFRLITSTLERDSRTHHYLSFQALLADAHTADINNASNVHGRWLVHRSQVPRVPKSVKCEFKLFSPKIRD